VLSKVHGDVSGRMVRVVEFFLMTHSNAVCLSYCTDCKKKCKSEIETCFLKPADVLFFQLRRFKYDYFRKSKDTTRIDFPLEYVYLSTTSHEIIELRLRMNLAGYFSDTEKTWNYKLIAFSDHEGGLNGGHCKHASLIRNIG
jgi:ubiquitin C-terminal hydrolase